MTQEYHQRPRAPGAGVVMILLTLACWTFVPVFLRSFITKVDPWTANGWRYGFSALMWLPVLIWRARNGTTPPGLWKAALWPSLFNTVAQVCFGMAPYFVSASLMTFSLRVHIVFLTFGAAMLFAAERRVMRSPLYIVGLALLVIGTTLVIVLKPDGLGGGSATGVALSIGAGILYAAYALSVRKLMHHLPAFTAFAAVSQYTGAALVLAMLFLGKDMGAHVFHDLNTSQWAMFLASSLIGIGIGHTLYYSSIQRLGLAVSAGVVQLQPVTVSIFEMLFLTNAQPLSLLQWITGILAIVGAVCMLYAQQVVPKAAEQKRPAPENRSEAEELVQSAS